MESKKRTAREKREQKKKEIEIIVKVAKQKNELVTIENTKIHKEITEEIIKQDYLELYLKTGNPNEAIKQLDKKYKGLRVHEHFDILRRDTSLQILQLTEELDKYNELGFKRLVQKSQQTLERYLDNEDEDEITRATISTSILKAKTEREKMKNVIQIQNNNSSTQQGNNNTLVIKNYEFEKNEEEITYINTEQNL